ncbi:COQ6 monooxygenase [Coprinopsis cinerea okayama7|uniref:COQ6 monooxygenase n=1 Tax=Coprinopsis cinerea (strain Okayama-7 / 130 / ATCC MYA-4618 / FGSC 9003) TaxID=240176 RepID=A8N974_COPC7|nr:COQ6 monooxygenase [Coprinopsis cinerea okayama7\|eukprot:XP_001831402.2 COQ6 monooxygenase [Coprinopsis cinerea okayama7\
MKEWAPGPGLYSNRVVSLTNASQAFLKRIGAWSYVEEARTTGVWDGVSDARITFSASDIGLDNPVDGMSRLTENFNLQRGLLRHLSTLSSRVQLLERTKVQSIQRTSTENSSWPLVHLDNGKILRSRLLVGADGFNSPVRTFAGIQSFGWSYDTQAIVATMEHEPRGAFEPPNTTAYQRFLPTGPIAFLPLSPTVSSLVWSTRPHIAKALLSCEPDVLASMINAAFRLPSLSLKYLYERILEAHNANTHITLPQIQEEILFREKSHQIDQHSAYTSVVAAPRGGIAPEGSEAVPPFVRSLQAGSVASFPLRFMHADSYIGEGKGERTVLIGDAAHTIHPLAGQGLNLGLGDVECLAKSIENAASRGGDIGSYTALLPYAQQRYLENHVLMAANDKLHKIYSTELEPIVWARSVGLEVVNELDSLKAALMISAGAKPRHESYSAVWETAAKVIPNVSTVFEISRKVVPTIGGALLAGASNLLLQAQKDVNKK